MHTFEDKLKEYADLLVRVGVNVQKGQNMVITSQVDQAPFARLCAQAAYDAGARLVDFAWSDDAMSRMRYLCAAEETFDEIPEYRIRFNTDYAEGGACFLHLSSSDPENFKGVDPSRLERANRAYGKYMKRYRELGMGSYFPWSIGALASPAWAKLVFPNLSEQAAMEALWEKIFMAVRVTGDGTAVEKWRQHQQNLQHHVEILNGYDFDRLHYYNTLGSDFTVGLCRGHIWCAGGEETPKGQFFHAQHAHGGGVHRPRQEPVRRRDLRGAAPFQGREPDSGHPVRGEGGPDRGGHGFLRRGGPQKVHRRGRGSQPVRRGGPGALRFAHQQCEDPVL